MRSVNDFQAEIWGVRNKEALAEVNLSVNDSAFGLVTTE